MRLIDADALYIDYLHPTTTTGTTGHGYISQTQINNAPTIELRKMSKFDEDCKDLINLIYSILDYARLGCAISTQNSCNDCKRGDCKYKPDWGDPVRWNCPLWEDDDKKFKRLMEEVEE